MIDYTLPIFRPPSEAKSFILQASIGCSYNKCTYCAMYRRENQKFRIRPIEEIKTIIDEAVKRYEFKRVFISDGNALVIPQDRLVRVLEYLNQKCPNLERVTMYANVGDVLRKGVENLKILRELGLHMVYIGFESGDDVVLKRIKKGASYREAVEASRILKEAGIKNSVMVLLGIGGKDRSLEHALKTGHLLTDADPDYVGVLSLQIRPGAPIYQEWIEGKFELPDKFQMIKELEIIVENTHLTNGFFFSNHISNYLPLKARFPEDKEKVLEEIRKILKYRDESRLRPEFYRDVVNQY
ncbi:Oxygen-independent coproporphyrinogen-III oxidase-like protein YqeR [bacterium HR37]|nr:Oxygen-independent coproporphyrinogen-III oxidase-like protein YqeR [bacterium HR37]